MVVAAPGRAATYASTGGHAAPADAGSLAIGVGDRAGRHHPAAGCQPASVCPAGGGNGERLQQPSDRSRPQPDRGGHVRHRRRPATTNRPGRSDMAHPGGGRRLRAQRPVTPRRTTSRGPRRVTLKVAGLTAGAVLAAATVTPEQGTAMMAADPGTARAGVAEQEPNRFAGLPDRAAAAVAASKASKAPPKAAKASKRNPQRSRPRAPDPPARRASGRTVAWTASWYGPGFAGNPTASGEPFRPGAMTAAHKSLPFGTRLLIRNPDTGRSVWVRINDRGPYVGGRQLDLSRGAAEAIGLAGVGEVIVSFAA
jgi:rare lipoprotein A (peptidoglycan hydrolase)